jgi:fatty acid desaturase
MKSKGMGLFSTVFVVLLILKVCGLTAISWWWVFCPLLLSFGIGVVVLTVVAVIALVCWACGEDVQTKKDYRE